MSTNKGIITRPVSIADVQKTLGVTANDVGSLCTSDAVNKWAKYKPVSRAKLTPLTEEERKGTGGTGEYYGLQCTLTQITISPDMHNVGFEYIRPTGGLASPYRLSDFDGYDHAAEPDPTGKIYANEVYWQDEIQTGLVLRVYIRHYNWKGTGVSLDDIVGQLNGFGDIKENIAFCYPLIMLGSDVRCLQNSNRKQYISTDPANYCTTLATQNSDSTLTWWNEWEVPIDRLKNAALGTLKATVFLFYPKGQAAIDFINACKAGWVPYGNHGLGTGPSLGEGNVQTYRSFPIPEAVGIDIVLKRHAGPNVGIKISSDSVMAMVTWPDSSLFEDGSIVAGDTYAINVSVGQTPTLDPGLAGGKFSFSVKANNAGLINSESKTWTQLGLVAPMPGTTVYFNWDATKNGVQITSGSGSSAMP